MEDYKEVTIQKRGERRVLKKKGGRHARRCRPFFAALVHHGLKNRRKAREERDVENASNWKHDSGATLRLEKLLVRVEKEMKHGGIAKSESVGVS